VAVSFQLTDFFFAPLERGASASSSPCLDAAALGPSAPVDSGGLGELRFEREEKLE
jgi:hypothetical protein